MSKELDIQKISNLIMKMIKQEITDEEKKILDEWKNNSIKHEELYRRILNENYIFEQYCLRQKINTDKAWRRINAFSRKRLIRYIGYAVAFLLFNTTLLFWFMKPDMKNINSTDNHIHPGFGKATLIVSNSQEIQLYKDNQVNMMDHSGTKYRNDSSTLYYQTNTLMDSMSQTPTLHTLVVGKGGEFCVQLSDGTKVYLNSDSKLRYPTTFTQDERQVYLEGEAYFEVKHDKSHPFIVQSKNFTIKVLGTSFNVSNYKDDDVSKVVLLEGSVQVNKADKKYELKPNEAIEIKGNSVQIKQVNAVNAISWKNEKFYFSNERLEVVMMKLARWYDVNLFYTNQTIKDYHFSGFIPKYADITKAFDILELTTDVQFEIKDRTVIITRR